MKRRTLSQAERAEVRRVRASGKSLPETAKICGCAQTTVWRLCGDESVQRTLRNANRKWRLANPDKVKEYRQTQTTKVSHAPVIYLAYSADQPGLFKLGITTSIQRRLVTLRTGCPHIEFLLTFPGNRTLEAWLHATLEQRRVSSTAREWYDFESTKLAMSIVSKLHKEGLKWQLDG